MKKGLIIALVVIPLVGAGGGYFAATKGLINVPGVTPKKVAKVIPPKEEPKKPKVKVAQEPVKEPTMKKAAPTSDPEKGIEAVAGVWSNLKPDQLAPIAERYSDKDLAAILLLLDTRKTAALIALMKPERAEKLSRELQRQASVIESPA